MRVGLTIRQRGVAGIIAAAKNLAPPALYVCSRTDSRRPWRYAGISSPEHAAWQAEPIGMFDRYG